MAPNQVMKEGQGTKPKITTKPKGWGSGAGAGGGVYQPTGAGRGYGSYQATPSASPSTPTLPSGNPVTQPASAAHVVGAQRSSNGQVMVQNNGQPQTQVVHGAGGPQSIVVQPRNTAPTPQNTGAAHVARTQRASDGQAPVVDGFTPAEPGVPLGSGDANNSMSDTLRSMAAGNYMNPAMIPWMQQQTQEPAGWGFGTTYRGWGRGGGGGGGGWDYGGGGGGNPWMNYMMGLNNWQI